ncbi:MAG: 4Fe-4S binding protein [Theionarchaea archaeon]|nr:4Fe-4S binding protein [Theionarchaea archaeon]
MKHISVDQSKCFCCKICEIICSFTKEKEINPRRSRIKIEPKLDGKVVYHVCRKCNNPACVKSCPIHAIEMVNGNLTSIKPCLQNCSFCIEACPYEALVQIPEKGVATCDLCGECVQFCPVDALHITERGDIHA